MSAGRWRVYRAAPSSDGTKEWWYAVGGTRIARYYVFATWRQAYTYADKHARR